MIVYISTLCVCVCAQQIILNSASLTFQFVCAEGMGRTKSSYSDEQEAVKVVCILTATETLPPFSQVQVKQHISHQMSTHK